MTLKLFQPFEFISRATSTLYNGYGIGVKVEGIVVVVVVVVVEIVRDSGGDDTNCDA